MPPRWQHRLGVSVDSASSSVCRGTCRSLVVLHALLLLVVLVSQIGVSTTTFAQLPSRLSLSTCSGSGHAHRKQLRTGEIPQDSVSLVLQWGLASIIAVIAAFVPIASQVAYASDVTIAPLTCPSIISSDVGNDGCDPRVGEGAIVAAERNVKLARQKLEAAEKEAGQIFSKSETGPGLLAKNYDIWTSELKRLKFNKGYLDRVRSQVAAGTTETQPLRLPNRLVVLADDVEKEVRFWRYVLGMQRYGDLPNGTAVVSYGPPGLAGDEGGFFAVEIRRASPADSKASSVQSDARLSFVQIATPNNLRISFLESTGGIDFGGYGYYYLRSPAGVVVRAYIGDRRDPVEFVALLPRDGDSFEVPDRRLKDLGLVTNGGYVRVNSATQENMPRLPRPNKFYSGMDATLSAQVLLLPTQPEIPTPIEAASPAGQDQDVFGGVMSLFSGSGAKEEDIQLDRPFTPVSATKGAALVVYAPAEAPQSGSEVAVPTDGSLGSLSIVLSNVSTAEVSK